MVRPRHVARHGDLSAADPPHIGDGVMRGTKRPHGDDGGAAAGAAGDVRGARGLDPVGQGRVGQDGREAACPRQRANARRPRMRR
jgi:hypothetical protein